MPTYPSWAIPTMRITVRAASHSAGRPRPSCPGRLFPNTPCARAPVARAMPGPAGPARVPRPTGDTAAHLQEGARRALTRRLRLTRADWLAARAPGADSWSPTVSAPLRAACLRVRPSLGNAHHRPAEVSPARPAALTAPITCEQSRNQLSPSVRGSREPGWTSCGHCSATTAPSAQTHRSFHRRGWTSSSRFSLSHRRW